MSCQPLSTTLGKGLNTTMDDEMKIAVIGDFEPERSSHKATDEALLHATDSMSFALTTEWFPTPSLETEIDTAKLEKYHGIFCAPGGPYKSMAGALEAIRFARERGLPFIRT